MNCFKDEHDEVSFKRCIDIKEIAPRLTAQGFNLDPQMQENLGALLQCFGDIAYEHNYGEREPPLTETQRKAKLILEHKRGERAKNADPKGDKKLHK